MEHQRCIRYLGGLITLWAFIPSVLAQQLLPKDRVIDDIIQKTEQIQVGAYQFPKIDTGYLKLTMAFDQFKAINPDVLARLKRQKIFAIDLVYSQFPKNKSFVQLNRNRLQNLQKYLPNKIQTPDIAWRHLAQNNCHSYAEACKLFHGLVVYFYPLKDTLNTLPSTRKKAPRNDTVKLTRPPQEIKKNIDIDQLPLLTPGRVDYTQRHTFYQIVQNKYIPDDSTVYKVFERNRWDSMLVVVDWTGSMYKHGAQLLVWMKAFHQQKKRLRNFLFFNDGDGKNLGEKVPGNTGGLYHTSAQNLDKVIATMHKAEKRGKGGDGPENDLEAVLKGMKMFPDCKEIILIADATSPVRDYILLRSLAQLKRPIRIILCGESIMPDYILMAYHTNGSLHTLAKDITQVKTTLKSGKAIAIKNSLIKIRRKRFQIKRNTRKHRNKRRTKKDNKH